MHTHLENGTIHIVLVAYEHLAEVVGLLCLLQDLSLEVGEGRVVPAGARASLILDARDWILDDSRKDWFVRIHRILLCLFCVGSKRKSRHSGEK